MDTQIWPVDELKENPDQQIFGNLRPQKFDELKASIEKMGICDPILITESGVIVSGHQRVRAARELGMDTVPIIVVTGDGRREFVNANRNRHQLGPLAEARVVEFLFNVEKDENPRRRYCDNELRSRIAQATGKSLRHANRYMRLLKLPMAIQHAVDNELTQACAERICKLPEATQQAIADEISAGTPPFEAADRHLQLAKKSEAPTDNRPQKSDAQLQAQDLVEILMMLAMEPDDIINAIDADTEALDAIKDAIPLLAKAKAAVAKRIKENQKRLEARLKSIVSLAS